jgi:hypothetical protein
MLKRTFFFVGLALILLSIVGLVFTSTRSLRRTSVVSVSGQDLAVPPLFVPTRSNYPFTAEILMRMSPRGCSWSGLMGTVNDLEGKPLVGYSVRVRGDGGIDLTASAASSQFRDLPGYDESAWDVPINPSGLTAGVWHVQLYQSGADTPISDVYEVRLEAVCGASSAFIRFAQNH